MSFGPGFILSPQKAEHRSLIGTGLAEWEAKKLPGYMFEQPVHGPQLAGGVMTIDGSQFDWDWNTEKSSGWRKPLFFSPGVDGHRINDRNVLHYLKPGTLPAMKEEPVPAGTVRYADKGESGTSPIQSSKSVKELEQKWDLLLKGTELCVPPETFFRVIIDLENYFCAFHGIEVSKGEGSSVRLLWAESLYTDIDSGLKGDRDQIDGKFFKGRGDIFYPDGEGSRVFESLWWHAGRYVEISAETKSQPLVIKRVILTQTCYPLDSEYTFESSNNKLESIVPLMKRSLEMCMHETYMDCPYYEQLMYAGDTRLQILATYMLSRDDRLPRKAIHLFNSSRLINGLTRSRHPSRIPQTIPPFSLWWIGMVYDYMLWRNDPEFVRSMMPGVRGVIEYFISKMNNDGLVEAPEGWNYMDWVPGWKSGIPPQGDAGVSGTINWQFVLALTYVSELEKACNEHELQNRMERYASGLALTLQQNFWDEGKGLFADDLDKKHFSEHSQCLALLTGKCEKEKAERAGKKLLSFPDLKRTTIYFTHYLFETFQKLGAIDALIQRMSLWLELAEQGFKTARECPEPCRSDCHGWGAHPLYHYLTSVLGIRPASPGFKTVSVRPQLGPLEYVRGTMPHPEGIIRVSFQKTDKGLEGEVELPETIKGTISYDNVTIKLSPGNNFVTF
jgi:hypothetical protein